MESWLVPLIHPKHGFVFVSLPPPKKKEQAIIYPPPQKKKKHTKQRTEDKDKHALAPNRNALTTLTYNSPVSTQIKNVGMVI